VAEAARAELPAGKAARYAALRAEIAAVIAGEPNITARYATVGSLLAQAFPDRFFWTGFYVVAPDKPRELVVGPYQGTLGCLRIPFGKGVCGACAERGESIIVPDVHAFPGHIACDSRSNSESSRLCSTQQANSQPCSMWTRRSSTPSTRPIKRVSKRSALIC
jgi:GAF domain-containing protein